ncbi:MAG: TRAP transporter small permease subunit [Chloroherpetonaceae bacterium]|nr:TRAP transporter small permease subunit [Chloroherpetonaceae bacterium]MDW8437444.1 TRAP transporter small permease subunit [Chloroherpetonaceae bacterium]
MKLAIKLISSLNERVGKAVSLLNVALVLLICVDVAARYAAKRSSAAFYELEWHLFSFIFLLGAGWTLRHDKHVRVDILYAKASPRLQAILDIVGTLFLLFPFCAILLSTSIPYALVAFETGEGSPDAGGLPHRWVVKSSIAIGTGLLLLQGIATLFEKILFLATEASGKERAEHVA